MAQKLDLREGTGGTALGDTAARLLYLAACGSKSEVIHALKDHGVSIDERHNMGMRTPPRSTVPQASRSQSRSARSWSSSRKSSA